VALARCSRDPGRRCNCAQRGLRIENGFEELRLHKPQAHGNRCAQSLHAGLTDWAIHRYKAARQRFAHSAIVTAADRPNIAIVLERLSVSACVDCDIADPLVLQFDDVQSRTQLVSFLVRSWCSPQRLMDELRTCDVRCANCQPSKTAAEYFTCWLLGVGWRRDRLSPGAGYRRSDGDVDGVAQWNASGAEDEVTVTPNEVLGEPLTNSGAALDVLRGMSDADLEWRATDLNRAALGRSIRRCRRWDSSWTRS
jgi:hypothetical protein